MRFFYVFITEMNNNQELRTISLQTTKLLNNIFHKKTMKIPERDTPKTRKQLFTKNNNFGIRKKYKSKRNLLSRPDYLDKLVELYYDNDKNVIQYLESAHKKTHILPPQQRIIVIGDIHGDFEVAIRCLILAKCIKYIEPPVHKTIESMDAFFKTLEWIGGSSYIVQLGDQIDRVRPQSWDSNSISRDDAFEDEGSTLELFYLFWHLNNLATHYGGRVLCVIGNHEIMNVEGDFRYVSREEFRCFKEHLNHIYYPNSKYPYQSRTLKSAREILNPESTNKTAGKSSRKSSKEITRLPIGYRERLYAFSPSGLCANFLARNYYTMLQIGNWLFCHGSPTMDTVSKYPIDLINSITSLYLLGLDSKDMNIEKHFDNLMHDNPNKNNNVNNDYDSNSIIWSRIFGDKKLSNVSKKQNKNNNNNGTLDKLLNNILTAYNTNNYNTNPNNTAQYIAVGHTPQMEEGINSICNGRVWRCDIGMSKAFMNNERNRKVQILEILNNKPKILTSEF
jgi:hypothetical protein